MNCKDDLDNLRDFREALLRKKIHDEEGRTVRFEFSELNSYPACKPLKIFLNSAFTIDSGNVRSEFSLEQHIFETVVLKILNNNKDEFLRMYEQYFIDKIKDRAEYALKDLRNKIARANKDIEEVKNIILKNKV